jgi:hypothetical protein
LTHVTARRGDHDYDSQDVWVFHLREGQISEAWWRPEDLYGADGILDLGTQAGRPARNARRVLLRRFRTSARNVPASR